MDGKERKRQRKLCEDRERKGKEGKGTGAVEVEEAIIWTRYPTRSNKAIISYTQRLRAHILPDHLHISRVQADLDGNQGSRRVERDTEGMQERPGKTNCNEREPRQIPSAETAYTTAATLTD